MIRAFLAKLRSRWAEYWWDRDLRRTQKDIRQGSVDALMGRVKPFSQIKEELEKMK